MSSDSTVTEFLDPLRFDGDWNVALTHVSFPSGLNNVHSEEDCRIKITYTDQSVTVDNVPYDMEIKLSENNTTENSVDELAKYDPCYVFTPFHSRWYVFTWMTRLFNGRLNIKMVNMNFDAVIPFQVALPQFDCTIKIYKSENLKKYRSERYIEKEFYIPPGQYTSDELMAKINTSTKDLVSFRNGFAILKDRQTKYSDVNINNKFVLLSSRVSTICKNRFRETTNHCFVYCDLVEPSHTGGRLEKVLDACPIQHDNKMTLYDPRTLIYRPLIIENVNRIKT